MIVDLLRNDLSQVAEVGSVRVPSLFDMQALPTVWQMTSTITARSRANLRLSEAFAALFPCGSITVPLSDRPCTTSFAWNPNLAGFTVAP